MDSIIEFAKRSIKETFEKDKQNMPMLYNTFSEEEKEFINEFMKRFNPYTKQIIFNVKSGYINFQYKDIQLGRIRLNSKKHRMQVLTINNVKWFENITLEEAIKNIDLWLEYFKSI
jgi:hypothetical protein